MNVETIRVARREFTSKNALNIGAIIEKGEHSVKESIFIELTEFGQKGINIRFDALELRALSYAIKALYKNGKSSFQKGSGAHGSEKRLWLMKGEKNYFINARQGEKTIGFLLDAYRLVSLADTLTLLADEVERALYRLQTTA